MIQAVRLDYTTDAGAYSTCPFACTLEATGGARMLVGPYRIRNYSYKVRSLATNTTPMGAYRIALDNELIVRKDVRNAILFATLGIVLLLIFTFPRPYLGLLSLLPAIAGGTTPYSITATATATTTAANAAAPTTITLADVLFGDVWVCGGQSNMEYTVGAFPASPGSQDAVTNATEEIAAAANFPTIRLMTVRRPLHGRSVGNERRSTRGSLQVGGRGLFWFFLNADATVHL